MIIKSDSLARTSHFFCSVCIAFVFLAFSPTVSLASDACKADVVFLMDNTGSMGGMISSTRTNAVNILNKIGGGDSRFRVSTFSLALPPSGAIHSNTIRV